MAKYRGPRLKIIRRIGENLPGLMYIDQKNIKKQYPPGDHGQFFKKKKSDYQLHLKEKQKLKYHYGVLEKQLKNYVRKAFNDKQNTGLVLLLLLEKRIDNIIYRSGLFRSIKAARQVIVHGHVLLNKKRNTIPSYITKINDVVEFHQQFQLINNKQQQNLLVPGYIKVDKKNFIIKIIANPTRKDISIIINEQLVIEYYSGR